MSIVEEVEFLKNVPIFSKVQPAQLKLLAFLSQRLNFDAGQPLFAQGDTGDGAHVIISGSAEIIVESGAGVLVVDTIGRNDFVGEIAILLDVPRTATVRAISPVTTLFISKDHFFNILNEFPTMAIEIMRVLAERVDRTTARLRDEMSRRRGEVASA